jgi:hypothetical protein
LQKASVNFLSSYYLISRIRSAVSTEDTVIIFMVGGYAWKMNGTECGVTASSPPPHAI